MIKKAQFASNWPTIYNLIKEMGLMRDLPPRDKIKLDYNSPQAGAFGYVTTEDVDENGQLDTMYIVVPNIEQHLRGINAQDLMRLKIEDPEKLKQILAPIVEIIAHEKGHQQDYQHGKENPFPGGEGAADQAAKRVLNQFINQATNNGSKVTIKGSSAMKKEIVARLVKLAGDLDSNKAYDLSDKVIKVAESFFEDNKDVNLAYDIPHRAKLYHPDGNLTGERVFTHQVDFSWGRYNGLRDQPYYIANDKNELGSVQFPGDPYTYDVAGPGKLRVVSAPENTKNAIGRIVNDPRVDTRQQAKMTPTKPKADTWHMGGSSEAERKETMLGKLEVDTARIKNKLDQADLEIQTMLQDMGWEGKAFARMYEKLEKYNYSEKIKFLRKHVIDFFKKRGVDTTSLEQKISEISALRDQYTQLVLDKHDVERLFAGNQQNSADDSPSEAEDESTEAYADLNLESLTKNASINAVFWTRNSKTPFGR